MKKPFISSIIICVSMTALAQTNTLKKGDIFSTPRKQSTDLMSQKSTKEDSTIVKTNNGFDVMKSKQDNMVYLNTNENNPSSGKMPIDKSIFIAKMPTRKLPMIKENFRKDSSFTIGINSDSLKKWKH